MSIWTDMAKYRVVNEELFYASSDPRVERKEFGIDEQSPTLEYRTFFKFMPRLNGEIDIFISEDHVGSGTLSGMDVGVFENDSLIYESNSNNLGRLKVKAFNKYELKFKNETINGSIEVPSGVRMTYGVKRNLSKDIMFYE